MRDEKRWFKMEEWSDWEGWECGKLSVVMREDRIEGGKVCVEKKLRLGR